MLYLTYLTYIDFVPYVRFKTKHNLYLNEHALAYRFIRILFIMLFFI